MNNKGKKLVTLQNNFIKELKEKGLKLSDDAVCRISDRCIRIELVKYNKSIFASDISIYPKSDLIRDEMKINFGSSGSFTPDNIGSYWRTIHAAEILRNWKVVENIVNKYVGFYKKITQAN